MSNLYRGPSIDAFYHVSYHLAERFQRKSCFRNQPIRNKNCLWWPCLITDQNGMINSHRCFLPRFGPFGQAVSEYKIFRNRPIRNKNCLWWPCLLTDRDEMRNLNRGSSIGASYQVSVHLVIWLSNHFHGSKTFLLPMKIQQTKVKLLLWLVTIFSKCYPWRQTSIVMR